MKEDGQKMVHKLGMRGSKVVTTDQMVAKLSLPTIPSASNLQNAERKWEENLRARSNDRVITSVRRVNRATKETRVRQSAEIRRETKTADSSIEVQSRRTEEPVLTSVTGLPRVVGLKRNFASRRSSVASRHSSSSSSNQRAI